MPFGAGLQPEHVDELLQELAQPHLVALRWKRPASILEMSRSRR